MFSDWKRTLKEIGRVSKPGAIIYLNYNHRSLYIPFIFPTGSLLVAIRDLFVMLSQLFF